MSERDWSEANGRYLGSAIGWVRARLESRVRPAPGATIALVPTPLAPAAPLPIRPTGTTSVFGFLQRPSRLAQPMATGTLEEPVGASSAAATIEAPADFESLGKDMMPPPALLFLAQRLELTDFERNVLLLCTATELDPVVSGLCAQVQGDASLAYPTFSLAMVLFDDATWEALSPDRPLRHWRLVDIGTAGASPLGAAPLRADERIVSFINGITYLDDRLAPLVAPLPAPAIVVGSTPGDASEPLAPSHRRLVDEILDRAGHPADGRGAQVIQLLGSDPASKRAVAAIAAQALGRHTYRLDSAVLPSALGEIDALARLWQRESLLLPVALYIEADATDGARTTVDLLLQRLDCLVFLASRRLWSGVKGTPLSVEVDKPTIDEQRVAWERASPVIDLDTATHLSEQFDLDLGSIRDLGQREGAVSGDGSSLDDRLWRAARTLTRQSLDTLSRRIVSAAGWDDLVLPAAETALLHQITDQVANRGQVYRDWGFAQRMSRGLGISVLFAGASGTGKTLAAEVLANHLRLDLFRIDLSAVMSKYIGETEINLRRLFDAAEGGGAVLFFDEADALFGKRTEVKDSHDRYANIEINYLLQRMEAYTGLAILATNMKAALDQAFMRRLRFVVDFPFPGVAEREAMWRKAFPANTPVDRLDYARLARLNLAGGHIAVIAVNAAFRAARADSKVTMPIVLDAARVEFRKLDRPVNEADFRWIEAAA